jgi:hypothetical protein
VSQHLGRGDDRIGIKRDQASIPSAVS